MISCAGIRRLLAVFLIMMITAGFARPAYAKGTGPNAERLVKAAYLFHFCGLVDWPATSFATPESPLRVVILGDEALADELERLVASRPGQRRSILVSKASQFTERNAPHLVYVQDSLRAQLPAILSTLKGKAVLTVTQSEQALTLGGVINFISVDGVLRFEISADAAAQANLSISSRLLAVSYRLAPVSPKFRLD
jgi:hypothetical protein